VYPLASASSRRNWRSHAAILAATLNQLTSVGYQRLTIERVAAEAGVGKATVYRWWPSKARLVVEALTSCSELPPIEPTGDLRSDVHALVTRAIDFIVNTPMGRTLPQLIDDFGDDPEARAQLAQWLGPIRAGHLALLYDAAGRQEIPHSIDPVLILDVIAGTVLYRAMLSTGPDKRFVDELTDFIIAGTRPA
jgi:AcrR family transcriptional regulator